MTDKENLEKVRAEIERLYNQSLVDENRQAELGLESAACTSYGKSKVCKELLSFIDSMQEEPVRIKKGCKYRCLSDIQNTDTGAISFFKDKIYSAPEDNTLVSEENGWLCDISENSSNFELVEEPVSEELEKEINAEWNCYSKDGQVGCINIFSFELIARHFANWQKQQMEAYRIEHCKSLTNEQAELEDNFVSSHVEKNNRIPTFIDAIEYGIEYGKQQMMAKVIDVEVKVDAGGYPYIPQMELYDYGKEIPLAKEGNKYKVILIKED